MKQFKKIVSNLPTTLCESNFNDFEYLMILKNKGIKKNIRPRQLDVVNPC